MDAELWTLLMLDEAEAGALLRHRRGPGAQEALRGLRVKVGEGVAGWVVQHGETLIVPEAFNDPRVRPSDAEGLASDAAR